MNQPVNVLLIEDNPGDARLVKEELRDSNFPIHLEWAQCLQNGLERLAQKAVQAVLVDLSLPDSEGLETLQRVLSCASQTPIIVMTGLADEGMGLKALQAGAQDYLIKGEVDGRLLRRVIQYAIQRKQAELDLRSSEEKLQNIFEHSSSVFYTHTPDHILTYVSPQSRKILDCEPEEAMVHWQEFVSDHPVNKAGIKSTERAIQTGARQSPYELELVTAKGRRVWVLVDESPVLQDGRVVSVVGSLTDITDRKAVEAALAASEKRFRTWLENSTDIVTVVDAAGIIQYESPSVKRLLGYELDELLGKNAFDVIHPEDQERILAAFVENMQQPDSSVAAEFRFQHKDGSWRFLEGIGRAYVDEHGEVVGLIHSRDITQRKQAEEAVASMQKRFQALIENAPDGIALLGLDGKLRQVTPSTQQILGYTLEEAEGQEPALLTHPDDLPTVIGLLNDLIQNPEKVVRAQYRFLHKDGSWRWLESIITNLIGEPSVQSIVFNYHDITERKQFEEKNMLQAELLNAVGSAVMAIDLDGNVTYWNPAAEKLLGWAASEALGRSVLELTSPFMTEEQVQEVTRLLTAGQSWSGERILQRKDGSQVPAFVSNSPLLDTNGKLIGMIGVSNNISELKQVQESLQEREDRYRDLVEHIRDLIGTHDLQGNILSINPAATELLGFEMDTLLRMNMRDFLAPEVRGGFDDYLAAIQRDGRANGLMLLQTKSGEKRLWEYDNTLRKDSANGPIVRALARDVTERKRAERTLREKDLLLSEAQRIGHIGSWSYDIVHDSMKFSDEMYRLLDVLPEDFQHNSEDFLALVYPSDRLISTQWMADLKEGMQSKDLDFRLFHKNGELCYLHCTGVVEYDENATPVRFIGTMQDVTERRVAEMQINQQLQRLMALSEIDRAIISSFDQRYILNTILSQVISQLHVDAADVLLLDPESETLQYGAGQGFRTRMRETVRLRMGEGHAGRAAKERRMIRLLDLRETTNDLAFSREIIAEDFVSYIGMPLIVKGKIKGVLEVFQRSTLQPYQDWLDFFNTLVGQTAIAIENTGLFENLRTTNQELIQAYDATIEGWSRAMDLRDRETEGHTQRVTKLTLELARALSVDEPQLVHIRRGALLHDIGKLGVPDHILFKAGQLTTEEREIIERHVDFAYEMLAPIPYLKPALSIPYFHHEKWDGTGYPLGLKGEQIPLEARIFALVDVWDALLSDRPYRKAWTREQTIEYIRIQAGSHFDPRVVDYFLKMVKA